MRPNTINGTFIGAEPATTATTTAAAAPWWAPYLTTIVLGVITAIPKGRQDVPGWDPTAINNLPDTNDTFGTLPSWLLPAGLAAGAYFLLKDEL
jgi:hypothetical protein